MLFLKEQKKELLRKKDNLSQATYEFYFENTLTKKDNILRKQFESAVIIIQKLIEAGVDVCTLGKRILRCETAPLCALSAVMYDSGEF